MRVTYKWLSKYIDLSGISAQQLADVMEQRILLQAQTQELLQRVEELEKELEQLKQIEVKKEDE